jgi:hypothetical protein
MTYKIVIGVTKAGRPVIGARECRAACAVETEAVFGSQLRYRVVARDSDGGHHICTATEASRYGWQVTDACPFPRQ